jgi:CubicO group peptidase (beta-lactamase class C family)
VTESADIELHGTYEPAFAPLARAFADMFRHNPTSFGLPEIGAAVSLVVDGETVVDLWAGTLADGRQPWQADTLAPALSCTKGIVAIAFHRLAAAGLVDVNEPVAAYWPEYAANGKGDVLVRHLLTHSAGQPSLGTDLGPGGVWDWDRVVSAFAAAPLQWEPGEAVGYHTLSFGHLVGEVIHRASGQPVGRHVAEVAAGAGAEFHLGITDPNVLARCADFVEPPDHSPDRDIVRRAQRFDFATASNYDDRALITPSGLRTTAWKQAGFPGAGGFTNARGMAAIYGALAAGQILPLDYLATVSAEFVRGPDRTLGTEQAFALGWQRSLPNRANRPNTGFGHSGAWGCLGWCEPERKIGFGYTMNQAFSFGGDERGAHLWRAATACLQS